MKFENTVVSGFEAAFRGMRNPLNSWEQSDSVFEITTVSNCDILAEQSVAEAWVSYKYPEVDQDPDPECKKYFKVLDEIGNWLMYNGILQFNDECAVVADIGPKDMELAQKLIKGGTEESKFLRQINVSVDITAPLYFLKELDTYKVGTTANSTSTMHKLASTPITIDCFETGDYEPDLNMINHQGGDPYDYDYPLSDDIEDMIDMLEKLRLKYNETQDKRYWKELVRWLPESWLQTRTWSANYQVLRSIYKQRKNHKLTEWSKDFVGWIDSLPYSEELIKYEI